MPREASMFAPQDEYATPGDAREFVETRFRERTTHQFNLLTPPLAPDTEQRPVGARPGQTLSPSDHLLPNAHALDPAAPRGRGREL